VSSGQFMGATNPRPWWMLGAPCDPVAALCLTSCARAATGGFGTYPRRLAQGALGYIGDLGSDGGDAEEFPTACSAAGTASASRTRGVRRLPALVGLTSAIESIRAGRSAFRTAVAHLICHRARVTEWRGSADTCARPAGADPPTTRVTRASMTRWRLCSICSTTIRRDRSMSPASMAS
jgi:hypothetical protein